MNALSNKDALGLLEKSVSLDPGYAPAWVALGQRYDNEAELASRAEEMFHKSIAAFERARQLDPELLSASTLLIEKRLVHANPTPATHIMSSTALSAKRQGF